jgi:GNAT superfamily N-acetyltransferase
MLKLGTSNDIPDIVRMAQEFHKSSPFGDLPFERDKIEALAQALLEDATNGLILLGGNNQALLAAAATEPLASRERMATELMWWVDPELRGTSVGRELLEAYEYWARNIAKCRYVQMVALETPQLKAIDRYYKRNGYVVKEHTYLKELH